tara:strand:+ start:138 stop:425 length:288 start_codon:yes stop_codon:yes gene_type:complete
MKEIYNMILKEKAKDIPNKEYIQFLQQMTDKSVKEYFLEEMKRQDLEKEIYKSNTQEVEDFFKNSGQTEESTPAYKQVEINNKKYQKWLKKQYKN